MDNYIPINGCVLVELSDTLQYIDIPDKQYSTKISGHVIAVPIDPLDDEVNDLLGKKVFFKDYEDGVQFEHDDKKYAFIKFEEIRGYVTS